jgi:hypothetical protein
MLGSTAAFLVRAGLLVVWRLLDVRGLRPFWHAAGMASLEDRYGSARLDVLIRMHWSRTSDDPPLIVSARR